jgi:hypothetical protein
MTRFLRRPRADRRLLALAAVLHVVVAIGVRMLPFRRVRRVLAWFGAAARRPSSIEHVDARAVLAVRAVAARLPGGTCLTDALVAQCLLARYGCETTLCFGVTRIPPAGRRFDAHAWLERDGATVIGARDIRYYPLQHSQLRCGPSPSAR